MFIDELYLLPVTKKKNLLKKVFCQKCAEMTLGKTSKKKREGNNCQSLVQNLNRLIELERVDSVLGRHSPPVSPPRQSMTVPLARLE